MDCCALSAHGRFDASRVSAAPGFLSVETRAAAQMLLSPVSGTTEWSSQEWLAAEAAADFVAHGLGDD